MLLKHLSLQAAETERAIGEGMEEAARRVEEAVMRAREEALDEFRQAVGTISSDNRVTLRA